VTDAEEIGMGRPASGRLNGGTGIVQSLSRGLDIVEVLAAAGDGLRLTELAHRVELSPSTTHRLLTTLELRGFATYDRSRKLWRVGVNCFAAGTTFLRRQDFVFHCLAFMRRLRDETQATVNLGMEERGRVVFLTRIEHREPVQEVARPGGSSPLHASGIGKALLAARERIVLPPGGVLEQRTPRTIVEPAALRRDLDAVRRRGWAIDDEENAVGLRCLGATIWDEHGQPLAAISVVAPTREMPDARLSSVGALVAGFAARITSSLAGRPPAWHA
jgi:IclR family transcriptional regulator, acetate operon repressor